jgi:hypothetical protein
VKADYPYVKQFQGTELFHLVGINKVNVLNQHGFNSMYVYGIHGDETSHV